MPFSSHMAFDSFLYSRPNTCSCSVASVFDRTEPGLIVSVVKWFGCGPTDVHGVLCVQRREETRLVLLTLILGLSGVDANLLVVLLEGSQILTSL